MSELFLLSERRMARIALRRENKALA